MQITKKKLDEIKPYEKNAKLHPERQIEQIKKSIEEFGNNDPIAIDEEGIIIEGHGRYEALKELGYEEAEVIILSDLSEEQKNAYRLVHNQLTMNSGFDLEMLKEELGSIDLDLDDFDFNLVEMENEEIERPDLGETYQEKLGLEVYCENEEQAEALFNELVERGYQCKAI